MSTATTRPVDFKGVVPGQCCACGAYDSAEWTLRITRDRSAPMSGHTRLCEECYRSMMRHLMTRPEVVPLRGYT